MRLPYLKASMFLCLFALVFSSCSDDDNDPEIATYDVYGVIKAAGDGNGVEYQLNAFSYVVDGDVQTATIDAPDNVLTMDVSDYTDAIDYCSYQSMGTSSAPADGNYNLQVDLTDGGILTETTDYSYDGLLPSENFSATYKDTVIDYVQGQIVVRFDENPVAESYVLALYNMEGEISYRSYELVLTAADDTSQIGFTIKKDNWNYEPIDGEYIAVVVNAITHDADSASYKNLAINSDTIIWGTENE